MLKNSLKKIGWLKNYETWFVDPLECPIHESIEFLEKNIVKLEIFDRMTPQKNRV